MLKSIKFYCMLIVTAAAVFLVYFFSGLFVRLSSLKVTEDSLGNILQHSENIISFATFLIGIFSVIIAILGFFTYYQYHKTEEIKNKMEKLLDEKKLQLQEVIYHQINYHFCFFNTLLNDIIQSHKRIISSINSEPAGLSKVIKSKKLDSLSDSLMGIDETFVMIRNLMNDDLNTARSALYNIIGQNNRRYIFFITQFISLRNNDPEFNELIKTAKREIKKMEFDINYN